MPLSLLQELIKRPSITPQECGIYEIILDKLNSLIQKEHIDTFIIEQEKEGVKISFILLHLKVQTNQICIIFVLQDILMLCQRRGLGV